jgi:tetratricopeptide (TPR) repeat protein
MTVEDIRNDPGRWFRLLARKVLLLLTGKEAGLNLSLGYMREAFSPVLYLMPAGMWLLWPMGAMGAMGARASRAVRALILLLLVSGATVVFFFISDRYRLLPPLLLARLAGGGVITLALNVTVTRGRELALMVCGFALFAGGAAYDPGVVTGDGQMRLLHALRLVEDGQIEEARLVAGAMPAGAMNPFHWRLKLARAYAAAGAMEAAEAELKVLLQMAPDHGPLHCELAHVYFQGGRSDQARAELARGMALSPHDPSCQSLMER